MNRTAGVLMTAVQGARWGLPWLAALAISVSVAGATTSALAGGAFAGDAAGDVAGASADESAVSPWFAATPGTIHGFSSEQRARDASGRPQLYVGLNSWIPVEPVVAPQAMPQERSQPPDWRTLRVEWRSPCPEVSTIAERPTAEWSADRV